MQQPKIATTSGPEWLQEREHEVQAPKLLAQKREKNKTR